MADDVFPRNLQNQPKHDRARLLALEVIDRWKLGGQSAATELLDRVCRIGKKWEQLVGSVLQDMLSRSDLPAELIDFLRRYRDGLATITLTIHEHETGLHPQNLEHVLGGLSRLRWPASTLPRLKIEFDTQYAYVYGFCAIAAWVARNSAHLTLGDSHERVKQFLNRAGVLEAIRQPDLDPIRFDTQTIFGFTRIDPDRRFDTDTHAGRLVRLFRENSDLSDSSAAALSIAFAELIENAVKHGEIPTPAWLFANYHPQPRIMHVCICDCGIGVQESFRRSDSPRIRDMAATEKDWIRHATEPLVTSKTEGHAGYGLYLVRELCRLNGGHFVILSGNATYRIEPSAPTCLESDLETVEALSYRWPGTFVAMQFRLDHPLELGPIYGKLPMPSSDTLPALEVDLFDE